MSENAGEKVPVSPKASGSEHSTDVKVSTHSSGTEVLPEPKKLSNKELKELKKKEKSAKRAAAKAAAGDNGITGGNTSAGSQNIKHDDHQKNKLQTSSNIKKQLNQTKIKEFKKVPPLFSHLETREQRILATTPQLANIVHPSILSLTLKYSTYNIVGSTPRCRAMLLAFKQVISSYDTPEGTTLSRNLTSHLSHQIEYLKTSRPLSATMGNAIRWLKQEISLISIDVSDKDAKKELCDKIDQFIREKLELAHDLIISNCSVHIQNNSTILTYGNSEVLSKIFEYCHSKENKKFRVIIVDSRPLFEGKKLAKKLCSSGIKCQYVLINALSSILNDVDYIMLGAHAVLSNGRLYSRVGTALIAMSATSRNIPVLVCCESIKFTDKVQLDSVTLNELADGDDLVKIDKKPIKKLGFALDQFLKEKSLEEEKEKLKIQKNSNNNNNNNGSKKITKEQEGEMNFLTKTEPLANWKEISNLNILNIMYDLTPPEYIKKIITEVGSLPPSSVPVILREYKST
ncbi:hypothetical protein PACTADRAFT_52124 [Pachysolen tannophilus NRRL Y-2460]|uniref:Translation initiation factor eIF2B subunit delta n=1 Tax=Pachysolen tannophilus NRRL Y-2460 TaxID=669874 RepID=A0A1E4TMZ6_PACTA|nr:hypothetical protein PACTADRAFT_52124 [Pachysolen tannophilus NRRL Y-2460]